MSETSSFKGPNPWVGVIAGAAIMAGGWYLNLNNIPDLHALEEQGIPVNLGKAIATLGVLLILFPVVRLFFIDPLHDAIQERTSNLESTFAEAADLRARMTEMKADYEQRLAKTEAEAREKIQATVKEAQAIRTQLVAEATAKADAIVKQAREEVEADRNRVLTELRLHVVDLSLAAASKVVGENMDSERNRKLVENFIDTVEAKA
ncbi:MAG: F0F1 ATP synthase subunit B [Fimbriimonas sp.]